MKVQFVNADINILKTQRGDYFMLFRKSALYNQQNRLLWKYLLKQFLKRKTNVPFTVGRSREGPCDRTDP